MSSLERSCSPEEDKRGTEKTIVMGSRGEEVGDALGAGVAHMCVAGTVGGVATLG
jgi:hypothetical protein